MPLPYYAFWWFHWSLHNLCAVLSSLIKKKNTMKKEVQFFEFFFFSFSIYRYMYINFFFIFRSCTWSEGAIFLARCRCCKYPGRPNGSVKVEVLNYKKKTTDVCTSSQKSSALISHLCIFLLDIMAQIFKIPCFYIRESTLYEKNQFEERV